MLDRLHVIFRGLGHGPRKLVGRVEDIVAGDLYEVHHGSSDRLIAPFLILVQHLLLRLIQGQLWPCSWGVHGFVVFHTVALYYVLRIVFLADDVGSLSRSYLKPAQQLLLEFV